MSIGILGKKIGMTRVYDQDGAMIPVTVIDVSGNTVLQKRTQDNDGYTAVQVGYEAQKKSRVTKAREGHFKKHNSEAKRFVKEFSTQTAVICPKIFRILLQRCSRTVNSLI